MKRRLFFLPIVLVTLSGLSFSPGTPAQVNKTDPVVVRPDTVGLSSSRLANIRMVMSQLVASKKIPGAIGLIARHGKVAYRETWGQADIESGIPMQMDAIYRLYSMSKPITSVALMMLYEEGKFQLSDPIAKFLPEFAKMTVGIEEKDPQTGALIFKTVPAKRQITVHDLLRHTAGMTYGVFGDTAVDQAYRKAGILGEPDLASFITDLARLPLQFEPGTRWHYSVAVDVQGRLIEVLSGKPFDQFLQERIFAPLKMVDTGFYVPSNKKQRLTVLYTPNKAGGIEPMPIGSTPEELLAKFPNIAPSYLKVQGMLSGGGGLVSTTYDYLRFCQMLLNKGTFEGIRLLSRKTVELMTSDNLGIIPGMSTGFGFGLGFAVSKFPGEAGIMGSKGEYTWGGAAGTNFWIDPQEDLIGIFMIQIMSNSLHYGALFRTLAYQSIDD